VVESFIFNSNKGFIVPKEKIAENDDYNLSADRYKASEIRNEKYPIVRLGDICEIKKGSPITKKITVEGVVPVIAGGQQPAYYHNQSNREGKTITISASGAYAGFVNFFKVPIFASDCTTIQAGDSHDVLIEYIYYFLRNIQEEIYKLQTGGGQPHVYPKDISKIEIPLPPLEVQKEIVKQLEVKQKAIEGAKQVIENLERERRYFGYLLRGLEGVSRIKLGEIGKISMCKRIFKEETSTAGDVPFYKIGTFGKDADAFIGQDLYDDYRRKYSFPKKGDILLSTSGTIGRVVIYDGQPAYFQDSNIVWIDNDEKLVLNKYLYYTFQAIEWVTTKGGTIERLYNKLIEATEIAVPDLITQKELVAEMESQDEIIESNNKLIEIMEKRIERVLVTL
ncbi:MAG: restriction endonuclease subunit S, partial [Minisyncoccia bacterium]